MNPIPNDSVTIEPAQLNSECAAPLVRRLNAELQALYPDEEVGAGLDSEEFAPPGGTFLLARVNGRPAGCGALRRRQAGVAEIKRMYVEPWARGRGLSRQVLEQLESAARRMGYSVIHLETGVRQPAAIGLYESAGYRRFPCYGEYTENPHSICFEKALS